MEALISAVVGVLTACGVYLLLRSRTFPVLLGLTLLSYAVNVFIFASGGVKLDHAPILGTGTGDYSDPLPQALVLTAIVIGFAMTAFVLVLALRSRVSLHTDHVDADRHRGEDP